MFIPEEEYKDILKKLPIACVDLLIIYEKKCLLLKRNNEPAKGEYWFPGGRIHKNESIANAAIRIAKGETNLDCRFVKIVSVEESMFKKNNDIYCDIHTINVCCEMTVGDVTSIKVNILHESFIWIDNINDVYHQAVSNPLRMVGFQ